MGLFADRSADAYEKAITAVEQGVATDEQKTMAGNLAQHEPGERGNRAREAFK